MVKQRLNQAMPWLNQAMPWSDSVMPWTCHYLYTGSGQQACGQAKHSLQTPPASFSCLLSSCSSQQLNPCRPFWASRAGSVSTGAPYLGYPARTTAISTISLWNKRPIIRLFREESNSPKCFTSPGFHAGGEGASGLL